MHHVVFLPYLTCLLIAFLVTISEIVNDTRSKNIENPVRARGYSVCSVSQEKAMEAWF